MRSLADRKCFPDRGIEMREHLARQDNAGGIADLADLELSVHTDVITRDGAPRKPWLLEKQTRASEAKRCFVLVSAPAAQSGGSASMRQQGLLTERSAEADMGKAPSSLFDV